MSRFPPAGASRLTWTTRQAIERGTPNITETAGHIGKGSGKLIYLTTR